MTLSLAAAASAQAQTPAPAPATPAAPVDFATQKTNIVARIDQRIAAMTATRDCVNAATTKSDLKACHKAGHGMHGKHTPA
jgi:hypothetical protein